MEEDLRSQMDRIRGCGEETVHYRLCYRLEALLSFQVGDHRDADLMGFRDFHDVIIESLRTLNLIPKIAESLKSMSNQSKDILNLLAPSINFDVPASGSEVSVQIRVDILQLMCHLTLSNLHRWIDSDTAMVEIDQNFDSWLKYALIVGSQDPEICLVTLKFVQNPYLIETENPTVNFKDIYFDFVGQSSFDKSIGAHCAFLLRRNHQISWNDIENNYGGYSWR